MEFLMRLLRNDVAGNRQATTGMVRSHLFAAFTMLLASSTAWSQAHEHQFGPYVIRSSTVGSENISAETAAAHGIERGPRKAILNVTVLKKEGGQEVTVPARLQVYVRNLTEQRRQIDMREVAAEGRVSYMGTYDFLHGSVLDFTINAQPANSGKTLTMTYRERMWAKGDLPDVPPQK